MANTAKTVDVHSSLAHGLTLHVSIAHVDHTFTLQPGITVVERAVWRAWLLENAAYPPLKSFAIWAAVDNEAPAPPSLVAAWKAWHEGQPLPQPPTPKAKK
jgi:hypothetical protein